MASPFFAKLRLENFGLDWIEPELPVVHPMPDGTAIALHRDLQATASGLGDDGARYLRLIEPFVKRADTLLPQLLNQPLRIKPLPVVNRFAIKSFASAESLARKVFHGEAGRGGFETQDDPGHGGASPARGME